MSPPEPFLKMNFNEEMKQDLYVMKDGYSILDQIEILKIHNNLV